MIEIKVNDSVVSVQKTQLLYSGSVDTHICHFSFDTGWDNFCKSAVFRVGGKAVTAVVDEKDCCTLPWELLTRTNIGLAIEVGVYGVSAAAEVLTTVWDSIGTVRDGSEIGNDAREPSAGVYEQVMAGIKRVDEKVVSCNEQAQAQVQRAESAAQLSSEGALAAKTSAASAENAKTAAQSALAGVQAALNNLPAGATPVINDLTTGGAAAALSAEMGKQLNNGKVSKNGDTMGGNLNILKDYPCVFWKDPTYGSEAFIQHRNHQTSFCGRNVAGDFNNARSLILNDSANAPSLAVALRLIDSVDGAAFTYEILHTGNKPAGSYTGNGDATARTIDVGGIWNGAQAILIVSAKGGVIVTGGLAVGWSSSGGAVSIAYSEAHYISDMKLTLATTNELLNAAGVTYSYRVL